MRLTPLTSGLLLASGLIAAAVSVPAFAHGDHDEHVVKKSKKRPSKVSFTLGVSVTRSLTSGQASGGGSTSTSGTEDHSGHQMLLLHGGAEDGDGTTATQPSGSGDSGGTAAPAFDPTFTARADYQFTPRIGLGLSVGFGVSSGVLDPEIGPTLMLPFGRGLMVMGALTASAPASKASQNMYKITTVKLTGGPSLTRGKLSVGAALIVAYAWYSKTVIVDDVAASTSLRGRQTPAFPRPVFLHGTEPDGDSGASGATFSGPSGDNLSSGDREFARYGARTSFGYQLPWKLRNDSSVGAAIVKHQFGKPTWDSDATVTQISYIRGTLSIYLALALSKSAAALSAPSLPSASLGAGYVFK